MVTSNNYNNISCIQIKKGNNEIVYNNAETRKAIVNQEIQTEHKPKIYPQIKGKI